ncbi:IGHMBP2, partial [Symbiodinium sp. CCMP2456]
PSPSGHQAMAEAEVEEYERGHGSGPQGTREVNFCDPDYWLFYLFPLCYYYGDMKLGQDDEEPEYGDLTYLAMVWCAGVAIGLIFYGVSEPLAHAVDATNKYNNNGYFNENEMAINGLHITLFHWGFLAWIVYAITALTMGFLSYRKGLPLCFRTTLAPLFGKATWGWMGDLLDVLTIVTIVAGLCTSLGLGARQIVGGLQRLEWLDGDLTEDEKTNTAAAVIAIITICATLSVVAGLEFGIKTVSYSAFMCGNVLMMVVFALDEPWYILNVIVQSVGYHLNHFLEIAFDTDAFAQIDLGNGRPNDGKGANPSWMDWWTIFYWGWWIAWAPFVGTFMARISRGRTIKQVVMYTLTLPFMYAVLWFCIFGAAGIRMNRRAIWLENIGTTEFGNADYFLHTDTNFRPSAAGRCFDVPASIPGDAFAAYSVNINVSPVCKFSGGDSEGYWFDLMGQYYGMGQALTFVSIVTTILYFVTSSDSGSLVVDLIAANGREAHVVQRVFWAFTEGAVAIACLFAGGFSSLDALQAVSIVMGLPFTIVMMMMCTSLWRALKIEAGEIAPRGQRTDWKMPMYGGIFDAPEYLLSCGRSRLPSMNTSITFALATLAPPMVFWRSMRAMSKYEKGEATSAFLHGMLTATLGVFFMAFVILHTVSWVFQADAAGAKEGKAMFCFAWIAYLTFASILSLGRHQMRRLYAIEGSGIEDICASVFLYPQTLCQMMEQVSEVPVPKQVYKKAQDLITKAAVSLARLSILTCVPAVMAAMAGKLKRPPREDPEAFAAWCEGVLALEKAAEEEELLLSCSQAELQSRGLAILKLRVAEQSTALYGRACLTLERATGDLNSHKISHGDIVGIFDQGSRPLSKAVPLASAVATRIRPETIQLAFDGDIPVDILDGRLLNLALVSSDVTLKRYKEALDMLKGGRARSSPASALVGVCFGDAKPRFHEAKSEDNFARTDAIDCTFLASATGNLNEPQQTAVMKALRAADVAVIHGPPGTGKTTTLVSYILEAVYRKQRLLVTAPSNVAVDNLLERLADAGCRSLVRLGHPARVQENIQQFTMDNVVYASDQAELCRDIKKEIDQILGKVRSKKPQAPSKPFGNLKELWQAASPGTGNLKCQTCFQALRLVALASGSSKLIVPWNIGSCLFDVVVIDEAAQALEVACWIPLLLGKKAVLAGDHQQLAACVKSTEAQQQGLDPRSEMALGLDETLFGRLIDRFGDDVASLLSIQYRSNEKIMGWSSQSFYSSRLEAAPSVASQTLSLQEVPSMNISAEILEMVTAPMLFVDTAGLSMYREDGEASRSDIQQSRCNPGESRFVVHYAKMLVRAGLRPETFTVITPYNRQVEQLRADFAADADVEALKITPRINTVDSFQGQEADAVLISLVRSNTHGVVGFLSDYRRLNVAVTRARKHVLLVGDASTICNDDVLSSLYGYACDHGRVAFVQQLLDEQGGIPADPSTAAALQEERRQALARTSDKSKEKLRDKVQEEEKLRQQFQKRLRHVLDTGQPLQLPAKLNPYERAIAHEVAKELGLMHESRGEGSERRLVVWSKDGPVPNFPEPVAAAAGPASEGVDGAPVAAPAPEEETALEAFERRARDLLASLGPGQPVAEWKSPTDVEVEVLQRLAGFPPKVEHAVCYFVAGDLQLEVSEAGSGKKRRLQLKVFWQQTAGPMPKSEAGQEGKSEPPSGNAQLASLHEERRQRQLAMAEQRKKDIEKSNADIKVAKQAAKKEKAAKKTAATTDDDDLDALLSEFTKEEGICSFANCKEKTNTLMDTLSKCKFCSSRFCLKHVQAEVHGCGDQAQRMEQKKWKEAGSRGSGLVNRSAGKDGRGGRCSFS